MVMKKASVAELKAKLSEYLAAVKRGQDVIVTERGKPIARLTQLADQSALDAHWAELIRTGAMRPPAQKLPKNFFELPRSDDPEGALLKALLEEREERR